MYQALRCLIEVVVLFSTILASSMAFIDTSALNVALPALQDDSRRAVCNCCGLSTPPANARCADPGRRVISDRLGRKRYL